MEEYYQTTINDLRNKLKEKDKVIKQLEEKLDKNQIIKELEREKSKNKKLKSALKIAKDNEEYLKKKMLLFSVFNLKENKEIIGD